MSPRALKVCPVPGCPELVEAGRCDAHRRESDQARGTATSRGYTSKGHTKRFRPGVLSRDPLCVLCMAEGRPPRLSTVADHWPLSRRQLLEQGLDPDDPDHGRGLCKPCHDRSTAEHQPGGFNAR
jgi:5-methylcytosine-specific restriction protein A